MKLYDLAGCPYCAQAIAKIDELGIQNQIDFVEVPRAREARVELSEITGGVVGVPTLVDGSTVIADDDDKIIAYLDKKFGEKQKNKKIIRRPRLRLGRRLIWNNNHASLPTELSTSRLIIIELMEDCQ